MYRRFYFLLILRVLLLVVSIGTFAFIFGSTELVVNHVIVGSIIVAQVIELIRFVNQTNSDLVRLFNSLHHSDFAVTFQRGFKERSFRDLDESLNRIVAVYKEVKIGKEAQFHLLQTIINNVNVGILAIENGTTISLANPACEKLLGLEGVKNWKLVGEINADFYRIVESMGSSGRKLVELTPHGQSRILSVDLTTMTLLEKRHRIVIVQDINNEIEQKEFEAWNKLIRILTHEIMNSVTPISSLTETMRMLLEDSSGNPRKLSELTEDKISDILFSLKTIQRRSDGMLDFADAYRTFSRVPAPVLTPVVIQELLESVAKLMDEELARTGIQMQVTVSPEISVVRADRALIEQVLINLITNSVHALKDRPGPMIKLLARNESGRLVVEVSDNGMGIPEKELSQIFVPFYSTRKDGSGIGLSLSKQIMSLHGGAIRVKSIAGEGTSFYLSFRL